MPDTISSKFRLMVPHGELQRCIAFLEDGLRSLKRTPYHRVLGRDFLSQSADLGAWIAGFARKAHAEKVKLKALYLEMNGFSINPDRWYCNLFGYKTAGGTWDLRWLYPWDAVHPDDFVLQGMKPVQNAFANLWKDLNQPLGVQLAAEIAEHLVTARFMELVAAAHKTAKRRFRALSTIPVLATAHDWDIVHRTV